MEAKSGDKAIVDVNLDVIRHSIDECECRVCKQKLSDDKISYLQSIIDKLETNEVVSTLSEIHNDINRGLLIADYEKKKQKIFERQDELEERISYLEEENNNLHARIVSVNIEEVKNADERKIRNRELLDINQEKRGEAKGN